jgi:UDP-glucose 4-epimerase
MQTLARDWSGEVSSVVHLAGYGRVVAPVSLAPAMYATAIQGTLNVLESFSPRAVVLASTCAVYGTTGTQGTIAGETPTGPLGLYGFSRTACESLVTTWAIETGNTAVILRFGNVIGEGCGGLIPYLVDHAIRHPDGTVPAQLRGGGCIIRDYVPVAHVVRVVEAAARHAWRGASQAFFNLGCGRGKANGEVAQIVTKLLAEQGYRLQIEYSRDPGLGESRQACLDVGATSAAFGIDPPSEAAVQGAIARAVTSRLASANSGMAKAAVAAT